VRSLSNKITPRPCRSCAGWLLALLICLSGRAIVLAAPTYYVAPSGTNGLSSNSASPGNLFFAVANAPAGSTVILENGTYDGAPNGFRIAKPDVTFVAKNWRGATVVNSVAGNLWDSTRVKGNVCKGIVFGPSGPPFKGIQWSGGGGENSRFVDCEFMQNGGVGFGSYSLVEHCLFTDQWANSFDINFATGVTMRNCIARRGNRANGDSDSIGNKEDFSKKMTFDGLIAYDNESAAIWFDTDNTDWTVENCTLFANHGGNNWYNLDVKGGNDNTTFFNYSSVPWGSGQDQEGVPVGSPIMGLAGTAANIGAKTTVVKVDVVSDHKTPPTYTYTYTVSPALPAVPANGDDFAVQQKAGGASGAYACITEANPNGTYVNNVTYSNMGSGFYDHASGNGYGIATAGLTVTGNLFVDDADGIFFSADHNEGNNYRQLAAADISHNQFKFDPGKSGAFASWGNGLSGNPKYYGVKFDYNTYDAENDKPGWAVWWGDPVGKMIANGLSDLQNPTKFDQDRHSAQGSVTFRGTLVPTYDFPAATDTEWSHICFPNNKYAAKDSIRQVNDDETPYIQKAVTGQKLGRTVALTVFGHTVFKGNGPYTCEVYDYSGRWIRLDLNRKSDMSALDAVVPGYAVLRPSHIKVTLTSLDQYALKATYRAGK